MINEGSLAHELENVFRDRFAAHTVIACGSGSQALMLALKAVHVCPGDQVMVPTYVCAEVLSTIEATGATALIVDVEDDYLMSFSAARAAQTVKCKAIIFPYVMGIWRDVTPFRELGLPIIEDCAQFIPDETIGFGSLRGDLAIFSFEATKLITSAEGGMVVACDQILAGRLEAVKRYGDTNYKLNLYPLADLLAALALSQLSSLPRFLRRRRELANNYFEKLAEVSGISLPQALKNRSIFFRFPVRLADHLTGSLEQLFAELLVQDVVVRRPVDLPLHRIRRLASGYPNAEYLYATTISLPIYPSLIDADQVVVVEAVRETIRRMNNDSPKAP